jgi:hypothetical protein
MQRALLACSLVAASACGATPSCGSCASSTADERPIEVRLRVEHDGEQVPVSEAIFGVNGVELLEAAPEGTFTVARFGGNRATTYNWENDASNGAADHFHQNDGYFSSDGTPASAWLDFVRRAAARGARSLLTVSMIGHVAADRLADGDVVASEDYLNRRFVRSVPACEVPAEAPRLDDGVVCQEHAVAYVQARVGEDVLGYALDNEPGAWPAVHPRIREHPTTYAELIAQSELHAAAIRRRAPSSWVFGPVSFGWAEMVRLVRAPDARDRDFLATYLEAARTWESARGTRLLDVLDVHWYPEVRHGESAVTNDDVSRDVADLRMAAPRSLYDADYVEPSWITRDWLEDEPIVLLPRLHASISAHYPGTRLAITEWHYGGGSDVSGAVAAADALGAFSRHRVAVATLWPLTNLERHDAVVGAFRMYRDATLRFGATSLPVVSDDSSRANGWASLDDRGALRLVVVVRHRGSLRVRIATTADRFDRFDLDVARGEPTPRGGLRSVDGVLDLDVTGPAVVTLVQAR